MMNRGQENLPASVIAYCVSGNQYLFIEQDRLRVMVVKNTSDPVKDLTAVSMPEQKGREKSVKSTSTMVSLSASRARKEQVPLKQLISLELSGILSGKAARL
ncbi:MAG: hypothetical protein IPP93_03750 [Chitinophagaceae bacterium]|nr:hypothetical protein [Chitinophagaceae bacterium]